MSRRIAGFILIAATSLGACGKDEAEAPASTVGAGNDSPAAATAPAPVNQSPQTAPDDAASQVAGRRGFRPPGMMSFGAECDGFLRKYAVCMREKAPEESRAAMNMAMKTWQSSWRELAASPTTSGAIAESCRAAQDSVRSQMASFGCEL
jgi:hypothetical protein